MAGSFRVRGLLSKLCRDTWRDENPFSEDVATAHQVLLHPYADPAEQAEALGLWMQRYQPCLFGRIAAKLGMLHIAVLGESDLRESDQYIAQRLREERLQWKRRSVHPDKSLPAHGFVLAVIAPSLAYACPNAALLELEKEILRLWGCDTSVEPHGTVYWETLYLRKAEDTSYVKFEFSVDFFSSAGDGRWWHDHRIPGGVAFTANSAGHMRRYREWYRQEGDQCEWALKTAMETISLAENTKHGKATWLLPLVSGRPFVEDVTCPFADYEKLKPALKGVDWTRYSGHLHTDLAVREAFFDERHDKSAAVKRADWRQDFQYIYDRKLSDHQRFMGGTPITEQEVYGEIGRPEEWERIVGPRERAPVRSMHDLEAGAREKDRAELQEALQKCRGWTISPDELQEMGWRG